MSREARQRALAIALPGLLLGVGYLVVLGAPGERSLEELADQVATLKQEGDLSVNSPPPRPVPPRDERARVDALGAALATPYRGARSDAMVALARLVAAHDLEVVREGPPIDALAVPDELVALAAIVAAAGGGHAPPAPWRYEVGGTYASMLSFLAALHSELPRAIPLSVSLRDVTPGATRHRWILVVWI